MWKTRKYITLQRLKPLIVSREICIFSFCLQMILQVIICLYAEGNEKQTLNCFTVVLKAFLFLPLSGVVHRWQNRQ